MYSQDPNYRAQALAQDKATNYGVVRLELIEEIYNTLYSYKLQYTDESEWPRQILTYRDVTGLTADGDNIRLHIKNNAKQYFADKEVDTMEELDVDLVVIATGYSRDAHEQILDGLRPLTAAAETCEEGQKPRFEVDRSYRVQTAPGKVSAMQACGCKAATRGPTASPTACFPL